MAQIFNIEEYDKYVNSPENIERNVAHPERFLMEGAIVVVYTIMPAAVIDKFATFGIENLSIDGKESLCRDFLNAVFFGNMTLVGNYQKQMMLDKMVTAYEEYIHANPTAVAEIAKMSAVVMLQKLVKAGDICMSKFDSTPENLGKFTDDISDIGKAVEILM